MKRLKWSDFDWFKKNSKVYIGDTYIRCSEKKGVDQKVIFPLKELGKHLTFSISNRYVDLHVTNEDRSIGQKSILEIRTRKAERLIRRSVKRTNPNWFFIPINDKRLKRFILVDPFSKKFIQSYREMNRSNLLPHSLLNNRIHSMRNYHGKILSAYDCFGRLRGYLKCDHERNGFLFAPAGFVSKIQNRLVNMDEVNKALIDTGLKESKKSVWVNWYKYLEFHEKVRKYLRQTVFSLRCFFALKIR